MKQLHPEFLKKYLPERDDEGNVVLHMTVQNDEGFLSPFSKNSAPTIASDVACFIESQSEALPAGTPLSLHVHSDCIDEREKDVYKEAIRSYYAERHAVATHVFRRNLLISLVLAVLGIFVLGLAVLTEFHTGSPIWTEVVDIIAWVLLWEAVDVSLFRNHELRENRKRYKAFLSMPIRFSK